MENNTIESSYLDKIGISGEKIFGYLYAGILALICFAFIDLDLLKNITKDLGAIIIILIIIGIGTAIYVIYFRIIGDLLLFQAQHLLHKVADYFNNRKGEARTCSMSFLEAIGVSKSLQRPAYESIKNDFITSKERKSVQIAHGELHILYLTFVELFLSYLISYFIKHNHQVWFLCSSLICLALAFIADTMQHMRETAYLKRNETDIITYLKELGFIK
ncbi:MAG TPA: hypothetical protein VEP89_11625 [Draconibacterium sp.]|nr:hypothetical protein [Draconibacterium sp.]